MLYIKLCIIKVENTNFGGTIITVRIWPTLPWQLQDQGKPDPGVIWCLQAQALACVAAVGPLMRLTWKPGGKFYLRSGSLSQNQPQQQRSLVVFIAPELQSPCVPLFLHLCVLTPVFLHLLLFWPCPLLLSPASWCLVVALFSQPCA